MSSNDRVIEFRNVWKKYSRDYVFHRSLREDIVRMFTQYTNKSEMAASEFWALRNIDFFVRNRETIGIYGHNGAGKSTILKLIASVTSPTIGDCTVNGSVAPLIEIGAGFHPDLTGRENIFMNGTILGMSLADVKRKMDSIIEFSDLTGFIDMPVKKYSSGMYLRLGFSIAFHSEADIYLIDEILAVGDKNFQQKCLDKIQELKKKGKTLVVITHDRALMDRLVDRVIEISRGEISGQVTIAGSQKPFDANLCSS